MASVNGVQIHYVIGGHGDPVVFVHDWHTCGMNGAMSCQLWLKIILSLYLIYVG
jgi:pimeloyl-ACP methyl ester carboxylesterase